MALLYNQKQILLIEGKIFSFTLPLLFQNFVPSGIGTIWEEKNSHCFRQWSFFDRSFVRLITFSYEVNCKQDGIKGEGVNPGPYGQNGTDINLPATEFC